LNMAVFAMDTGMSMPLHVLKGVGFTRDA
jgi:hypothetical protein